MTVKVSKKEKKRTRQSRVAEPAEAPFAFKVSTSLFFFHSSFAALFPRVCPSERCQPNTWPFVFEISEISLWGNMTKR